MSVQITSEGSQLIESLRTLRGQITKLFGVANLNNDFQGKMRNFSETLTSVDNYLLAANWELTNIDTCNKLLSILNADISRINNLINNPSIITASNIIELYNSKEEILTYICRIPSLSFLDKSSAKDRVKSLRLSIDRNIELIEKTAKSSMDSIKASNDTYHSEFNALKTTILDQLDEIRSDIENNSDEEIKKINEALSQKQAELLSQFKSSANTNITDMVKIKNDSSKILSELETNLNKSKEFLQAITSLSMSGVYQTSADEEAKLAQKWQIATLVSICISVAIFMFIYMNGGHIINLLDLFQRFFISITLMGAIAYCGYQSFNYRKASVCYRQLQMELSSISSYFAELSVGERANAMLDLSSKYFKGVSEDSIKQEHGIILLKLLEKLPPDQASSILPKILQGFGSNIKNTRNMSKQNEDE